LKGYNFPHSTPVKKEIASCGCNLVLKVLSYTYRQTLIGWIDMKILKHRRVILDNSLAFHAEVKAKAALRGMTIKDYVTMAVLAQMKRDSEYK